MDLTPKARPGFEECLSRLDALYARLVAKALKLQQQVHQAQAQALAAAQAQAHAQQVQQLQQAQAHAQQVQVQQGGLSGHHHTAHGLQGMEGTGGAPSGASGSVPLPQLLAMAADSGVGRYTPGAASGSGSTPGRQPHAATAATAASGSHTYATIHPAPSPQHWLQGAAAAQLLQQGHASQVQNQAGGVSAVLAEAGSSMSAHIATLLGQDASKQQVRSS